MKSQSKVTGRPILSPINENFLKQLRKKTKLIRSQVQLYVKFYALNIKVLGIDQKRAGKSKIALQEAYQQIQIEGMTLEEKQSIINQIRSISESYQFCDYLEKKQKGVFSDGKDLSYVLFCLRNSNLFQKQEIPISTQVYIALILFKEKHQIFQKTLEILETRIPQIITNLQKIYIGNQNKVVEQLNQMELKEEFGLQQLIMSSKQLAQQSPFPNQKSQYQQQQHQQQQQQQQQINQKQQKAAKKNKNEESNVRPKKRIRKPKQIKKQLSQEQKEQIINNLCQQICIYIYQSYVYALQQ